MKKNYRRKIKQNDTKSYWTSMRKTKKFFLKHRVSKRRQRDRLALIKGLRDGEESWDDIVEFEWPVDWYSID